MSTTRTPEQIQQEYAALCAQSGEKAYQILILQKDVRKINARINALNKEMGEALKAKAAADQATLDKASADLKDLQAKVDTVAEAIDEQPASTN